MRAINVVIACSTMSCMVGEATDELDNPTDEIEQSSTAYKIFNPASFKDATHPYDEAGQVESSASFQEAIDRASAYASNPNNAGLFVPPVLKNAAGKNVGPNAPQAIVRTNPNAIFKLTDVKLKSNVRLEIDASSTIIPIKANQQVIFQGRRPDAAYSTNITITSFGSSTTFRDTGRRCTAAGRASPCSLPKSVKYADMTFPDGKTWTTTDTALTKRFVIDLDYRRYSDLSPPAPTGDGPRGAGIKISQTKNFLVERVLELAFPGVVLYPNSNPPGPGGIGSNTYPTTAGNGLAIQARDEQTNMTENAVQPRNGTIRYMHCEGCTRGYGIIEVHGGVDLEYRYISTRGGIGVRWESGGAGKSTRQHAQQVVGYDCNVPVLMSAHENDQDNLHARYVKSVSCDMGIRVETQGGDMTNASYSDVDIYAKGQGDTGNKAQVILCRFTACEKYGVVGYDDDAWNFAQPERAIQQNNARSGSNISLSRIRCTPLSGFTLSNVGGSCSSTSLSTAL